MRYDYYTFNVLCITYNINGEESTNKYCITETKDGGCWYMPQRDEDFEELEDYEVRMLQYKKDTIKKGLRQIKTVDLFSKGKWLCVKSAKELYLDFIRRLHISEDNLVKIYKDKGYVICRVSESFQINDDDPYSYKEILKNHCGNYVIRKYMHYASYSDDGFIDNNSCITNKSDTLHDSECVSESEEEISEEELQRIREEKERREAERKIEEERNRVEEERKKKEREEEEERRSKECEERRRKTQYVPTNNEEVCYNCQLENGIIDSSDILHRCPKHIARFGIYRVLDNNDE